MRKLITAVLAMCFWGLTAQNNQVELVNGKFYTMDGTLFTGVYTQYEEGTKVAELSIASGELSGTAKYFHLSGALKESGTYKNGKREDEWKKYSATGNLLCVASFLNDTKHGKWLVWDNEGNLRFEMYYKNGKQVGTWKMWDANGELTTKDFGQ